MKKNLYRLTILLSMLVAVSCGSNLNDKERVIVGRWHYTVSKHMKEAFDENSFITEYSFTTESEDVFRSNYTEKDNGKATFSFHVEDEDYNNWIDMIYDISYEGTWSVKGNQLILKGDKYEMGFSDFSSLQKYNPDFDDYYIKVLKSIIEEQIPELRHESLKKRTQLIIDLSDDEMIVEEDGEKLNMVRIE